MKTTLQLPPWYEAPFSLPQDILEEAEKNIWNEILYSQGTKIMSEPRKLECLEQAVISPVDRFCFALAALLESGNFYRIGTHRIRRSPEIRIIVAEALKQYEVFKKQAAGDTIVGINVTGQTALNQQPALFYPSDT